MYTADEASADLVAGYRDWVADLCLKFSRATGWTVRLVKGNHQEGGGTARISHVGDFDRRFGVIELLLPTTVDDKTRRRASSATRLLVEMIQQVGGPWRGWVGGGWLKRMADGWVSWHLGEGRLGVNPLGRRACARNLRGLQRALALIFHQK